MEETAQTVPKDTDQVMKRPWLGYAVLFMLILLAADAVIIWYAGMRLWSPIRTYGTAVTVRVFIVAVSTWFFSVRIFGRSARTAAIVHGGSVFIVALIIASVRFAQNAVLWSFVNIAVEPFDSCLITIGVVYLIHWMRTHRRQALPPLTSPPPQLSDLT